MAQRSRGCDLGRIIRHGAQPVGDHIEKISYRGLSQTVDVVRLRGRMIESALHDHAFTVAQAIVAGGAVDIEPFLSAFEDTLA
jgi:hypothetical protein